MKKITLFQHQKKAIETSDRTPSQLIFRLPGTGKTLIGMKIVLNQLSKNKKSNVLWIGPANLEEQYCENFADNNLPYHRIFDKRTLRIGCCNLCSFDMLRLNTDFLCSKKWDLVLIDEVHKAKNLSTKTNRALWRLRQKAIRWYAFTGTPFQNNPYEFFELVSLCIGKHISFLCEQCLQYRFPKYAPIRNFLRRLGVHIARLNQGPVIGIRDTEKLHSILSGIIDYVPPEKYLEECHLPAIHMYSKNVEMSMNEVTAYNECLKQFKKKKKFKNFMSDDLPDENIDGYFKGLSGLRTIALKQSKSIYATELIEKIQRKDKKARILVFCNFVEHGLNYLHEELSKREISHIFYNGKISSVRRNILVKEYLEGTTGIMLLSPVGFEGLDLYGTTHIIILDPHYNPERTRQLISRAIRAYSDVQNIDIINLLSVSDAIKSPLIDLAIMAIAERKTKVARLLENALI